MATALLHDIIDYSTTRGSVVYSCSLDAEGAFDAIPHCILFDKAHSVLPTYCWFMMYEWYSQLTINITWRGCYSKDVVVNIGTRQGGLSSPLLFNIFYQDLIDRLSTQHCGISINKESFNVFCYADDLILTSLTVTGLQSLIDVCGPCQIKCSVVLRRKHPQHLVNKSTPHCTWPKLQSIEDHMHDVWYYSSGGQANMESQ